MIFIFMNNTLNKRVPYHTYEFWPSDTEELFNINSKKYSDSLHIVNYINNPIKYTLNNVAMRTPDDFTLNGDGNIFLGCSHTFGIGHHLNDAWSYKLSQKIGGKFYNISEPSSGIITQYRWLKYFSNKINFKNVFHYYPTECLERYEYFLNNEFQQLAINSDVSASYNYDDFYFNVLTNKNQIKFNTEVYTDAIKNICKENGANYYVVNESFIEQPINPYDMTTTPARDLTHYSAETHDEIVNLFYNQYNLTII